MCPAYEALRMSLFEVIRSEYSILASDLEVRMLDPKSLFRDMMASENIKVVNSLASFLYKAFRLREKLVLEWMYVYKRVIYVYIYKDKSE